jgi:ADP-ribosylglycohydrolase
MPATSTISTLDRYRGCLLGGAVGDALGAAVEFLDVSEIRRRFGADGIAEPARAYGRVGAITDDTQMTLFTAEGILQADDRLARGVGHPPENVWFAYQRWLQTQGVTSPWTGEPEQLGHGELHRIAELHSRRAPGNTCLSALEHLIDFDVDPFVAGNDSKGYGGVMRAAPCGLVSGWFDDAPRWLGLASAALTHGHPSGYLAAGALAVIIRSLCDGRPLDAAVARGVESVRRERGCDEVVRALGRALELAAGVNGRPDVARLGRGWVAEEALAIAVYCALVHREDFAAAVRLAANHSGDSDSTAAITGNIMGAHLGVEAIPTAWLDVLELRDTIDRLATAMHERFVNGRDEIDWQLWNHHDDGRRPAAAPPHDAYWVEPGRLLAGPYAGAKAKLEAKNKLEDFLDLGVTCFIDLTEEAENRLEPYAKLLRELAAQRGIKVTHLRMPIRDVDVAPPWLMRAIQDAIGRALDAGEVVYVHCWGGVGRTGTVIGCHLVESGEQSRHDALHILKQLRRLTQRAHRLSPETSAQRAMVERWRAA